MFWIIVEISVLVIVVGLVILYRKTIRPLNIIGNGMDLLKEQDFSSRLGYVGQKDADKIVDIFNKMMEQLKNERLHLREQNMFLDLLIESSPVGVIILDFDDKIMQINPAGCGFVGRGGLKGSGVLAEFKGFSLGELPLLGGHLAALEKGRSEIVRLNDGSIYKCTCSTFVESGFYHKFYMIEQMTQEVLKEEKRAYEKIIRTIAHEVNNSMAGISSTLDTVNDIIETPLEEGGDKEYVSQMLSIASDRCLSLSNFITNYANVVKIPQPELKEVNVNEFLQNMLPFLESMCGAKGINVTTQLCSSNPIVSMDLILMEQVLLNIVKNSVESIESLNLVDGAKRVITITTFNNGSIEIADNGAGISNEAAGKLFTPFFSTKPNGQGIGLIFIREVLQQHGLRFMLGTGEDGVTRFRVGS